MSQNTFLTYGVLRRDHDDQGQPEILGFMRWFRSVFALYEIMTPHYGPYRTVCFEFHSVDEIDQMVFFNDKFYPMLEKFDGITEWFSHVDTADSFNYRTVSGSLPHYRTASGSLTVKEEINQACRPGTLISRQFYLPITMGRKNFWPAILALQEETRNQFQREIRRLRAHHAGIMNQLWVEFSYSDLEDKQHFEEAWYAHMSACGLSQKFDDEIGQGYSELWYSIP